MQILPTRIQQEQEKSEAFFIELYNIHLRTGTIYIAACDVDIVFNGVKYISIPVERGTITRTVDSKVDNFDIKIADVDYDKLAFILNGFDFRDCKVELFRIVYPDSLGDASMYQGIFRGIIDSPSFEEGVFACQVVGFLPDIEVPQRAYQLCCNASFGDPYDCGMNKDVRQITLKEGTEQGAIFFGDADMRNYWDSGVVTIEGESRMIKKSTDKVYLVYPFFQTIKAGMTATIERGCDKTKNTCKNRYDNMINFSGFPSIPWESVYR